MSEQFPPQPGRSGSGSSPRPGRIPPGQERPTEFIPRVREPRFPTADPDSAFGGDLAESGTLTQVLDPVAEPAAPAAPKSRTRTALRTFGEILITAGMVVLLFLVYQLYVTNIFSAQKQASATTSLDKEWDTVGGGNGPARSNHYDVVDGHGLAKLYIPALGQDYKFTIVEGTTQDDLAIGPGHYSDSALPGQPGDFSVAGHRVGQGAPFNDLDLVHSCDALIVETQTHFFVYRMLPNKDEIPTWATGKGTDPHCSGANGEAKVNPLGGLYTKTFGQEIVLPSQADVVAPIPHEPNAQVSPAQEASLLTLTTCNPKFSSAQRLILHAVLVKDWAKNPATPNQLPPEMKETS